jgi:hypothetical protein
MSARAEIYWTRSSKQVGAVRQGNLWLSASGAGPKPFGSCPRAAGYRAATSCGEGDVRAYSEPEAGYEDWTEDPSGEELEYDDDHLARRYPQLWRRFGVEPLQ